MQKNKISSDVNYDNFFKSDLKGFECDNPINQSINNFIEVSNTTRITTRQTYLFWYRSYARVIPRSGSDRFLALTTSYITA